MNRQWSKEQSTDRSVSPVPKTFPVTLPSLARMDATTDTAKWAAKLDNPSQVMLMDSSLSCPYIPKGYLSSAFVNSNSIFATSNQTIHPFQHHNFPPVDADDEELVVASDEARENDFREYTHAQSDTNELLSEETKETEAEILGDESLLDGTISTRWRVAQSSPFTQPPSRPRVPLRQMTLTQPHNQVATSATATPTLRASDKSGKWTADTASLGASGHPKHSMKSRQPKANPTGGVERSAQQNINLNGQCEENTVPDGRGRDGAQR
jgi:hypothetical protein